MANDVRITNIPDSGSPHRVALELCWRIAQVENVGTKAMGREDTLRLYAQCLRTVQNASYEAPSS